MPGAAAHGKIPGKYLTIVHFIKSLYVLYVHIHVKLQNAKSRSVRVQRVEGGQVTDVCIILMYNFISPPYTCKHKCKIIRLTLYVKAVAIKWR